MTDTAPFRPDVAMILAAGRGTRLGPASELVPKPLVRVGGRALIDHALDLLGATGVSRVVVNTHHRAELLEEHLAGRADLDIAISREKELLDTGGGVRNALPLLDAPVFLVVNADLVWDPDTPRSLLRLCHQWNEGAMDALLLLFPTVKSFGYEGFGDFFCDPLGRLRRRRERQVAPFLYTGVQILHRRVFDDAPDGAFSMRLVWDKAEEEGRLFGMIHDGQWLDVGTPNRLAYARTELGDLAQGRLL